MIRIPIAVLLMCGAASAQTFRWPTPEWTRAGLSASVGFSDTGLAKYREWLQSNVDSKPWGTVIIRHGLIVFEEYGAGGTRDTAWEVGSLRKSIYSALVGMAIEEGKISLDSEVWKIWPPIYDLTKKDKDKRVLYRHLIGSTSGWRTQAGPGEEWRYSNVAFTAGHAVLARLYGLPDDKLAPLVEERLKRPLGAYSWRAWHYSEGWDKQPGPKLAVDSNLRDLARYGYLWLRKGQWNGRQLVPVAWIAQASRNQSAALGAHYGYLWMTNDGQALLPSVPADAYFHTGTGGERRTVLLVCPSLDLVAVIGHHKDAYNLTPVDINELKGRPLMGVDNWISVVMAAITKR